jgi:hypothetical protein
MFDISREWINELTLLAEYSRRKEGGTRLLVAFLDMIIGCENGVLQVLYSNILSQ